MSIVDLKRAVRWLRMDKRGVTALEYGLIASVVVGTIMIGFVTLANGLKTTFDSIGGSL